MDQFAKSLTSVSWWLGVVVVGVALNLISAYLKPKVDSTLSAASGWWKSRSEKQRAKRAEMIAFLRDNPDEQAFFIAEELRHRIRAVMWLIFSGLSLLLHSILHLDDGVSTSQTIRVLEMLVTNLMAALLLLFSALDHSEAADRSKILEEARMSKETRRANTTPNEGAAGDGQDLAAPERPGR